MKKVILLLICASFIEFAGASIKERTTTIRFNLGSPTMHDEQIPADFTKTQGDMLRMRIKPVA